MSNLLSFNSIITNIGYIIVAIIVLLFMVLIHELGHYVAGKILKFKINEFSIGFGPKLLQKTKKNGELISLRAFPLGGYCAFEGESEEDPNNVDAFNNQKPWKRLIVLFSGAFFNLLSAIIFSFILLFSVGFDLLEVKKIDNASINYEILQTGDVIHGVENMEFNFVHDETLNNLITQVVKDKYYNDYSGADSDSYVYQADGKTYYMEQRTVSLNIDRNGQDILLPVNVNVIYNSERTCCGWTMMSNETVEDEITISAHRYTFGEALIEAVPFTFKWVAKMFVILGDLFTGKLGIQALGGPVTTISMIAEGTKASFSYILMLLPVLAVNLAVFNLLPIPALDGCQMIFVAIEWIRKKPIKREVVNIINNIGLMLLLGLVIIVDVFQIIF